MCEYTKNNHIHVYIKYEGIWEEISFGSPVVFLIKKVMTMS